MGIHKRFTEEELKAHRLAYGRERERIVQSFLTPYVRVTYSPEVVREKRRIKDNLRAARKLSLPSTLTYKEWGYALSYFSNRCAVCGREEDDFYVIAQDHWIPLSDQREDNPGTSATNCIPLCHHMAKGVMKGCNNSKWSYNPILWLYSTYSKEDADAILSRINSYFDAVKQRG